MHGFVKRVKSQGGRHRGLSSANSFATTINGNLAQAQSTASGSNGQAQATAQTNLGGFASVQTVATSQVGAPASAIAHVGRPISQVINAGQSSSVVNGFAAGPATVAFGSMGTGGTGGSVTYQESASFMYNVAAGTPFVIARFGGDEFVVLLATLGTQQAKAAAVQAEAIGEKILAAFTEVFQLDTYEYPCTPSVGVTLFSPEDRNVDELLKRADLAMYDAKTAGRNGLRFFDPAMQTMITARAALETDLREDLKRERLLLHYQPQVDHEGKLVGAEALARWPHAQKGKGVETEEQYAFLAQHGQLNYQGYLFGRPLPPEDFERLARTFSPRQPTEPAMNVIPLFKGAVSMM